MQKLFPCGSLLLLHKQDTCSLFLFFIFFPCPFWVISSKTLDTAVQQKLGEEGELSKIIYKHKARTCWKGRRLIDAGQWICTSAAVSARSVPTRSSGSSLHGVYS